MKSKKLHVLAGAVAVLIPSMALAQTSASWNIDTTGLNFSTASNWSPSTVPGSGGTATFDMSYGQTSSRNVVQDVVGLTLGGITMDSSFGYSLSSANSVTLASGGFTLNGVSSFTNLPTTFATSGSSLDGALVGTTASFTKTGAGTVRLNSASSTFTATGGINVNNGLLSVTTGSNAVFGNTANAFNLNGGGIIVTTTALSTGRTINVGANGGILRNLTVATTLTGSTALAGSGTFIKANSGALALSGNAAGFTGPFVIQNGTTTLSSTFTLGGTADFDTAATVAFDNSTTNVNARLGTRTIVSRGATIGVTGNSAGTAATFGDLTLSGGNTFVTATAATGATAGNTTVTFSNLNRVNSGFALFRGSTLGSSGANSIGNILFTNSPGTLYGAGGSPTASTTASILPFAHGSTSTTATNGTTFVTWDSTTKRIVPLDLTLGYTTDINTSTANDNVNQNVAAAVAVGGTTINALRTAPTASYALSGGPVTINSGAVLATSATSTTLVTIGNDLVAPSGVAWNINSIVGSVLATTPSGVQINGVISGDSGLNKGGAGGLTLTNANNSYTGPTTIASGSLRLPGGTVGVSTNSYVGNSASAIVLTGGQASTALWTDGNLVINRPLDIQAGQASSNGITIGTIGLSTNESVTLNGNVSISNPYNSFANGFLTLGGNTIASSGININGVISGAGGLRANFGSYNKLTGNNTYSGGTIVGISNVVVTDVGVIANYNGVASDHGGETWAIGNNRALGTGTVYVYSSATATNLPQISAILLADGAPRTIANPIVVGGDVVRVGGTNKLTFSGTVDLNGGVSSAGTAASFYVDAGATGEFSGVISRGTFAKSGPGTLVLSNGANTFTGQARLGGSGIVQISKLANGGVPSDIGAAGSGSVFGLVLAGGVTLKYTGTGDSTNRQASLSSTGGTIDSSGSGPILFTNTTGQLGSNTLNSFTSTYNTASSVININPASAMLLAPGATVSGTGIVTGTTITQVGPNFIVLSTPTNAAGSSSTVTVTYPANSRTIGLAGTAGTVASPNVMGLAIQNSAATNVSLVKSGTGVWSLTNANVYQGSTTVNGGTLLVNNTTGSGTGTGAVAVNTGATLGGSGIISGSVTVNAGGTLAAGNSPGVLTLGANLTLGVGSTLAVELTGLAAGTQYDQIAMSAATGTVTLDNTSGAPTLAFPTLSGSYALGNYFTIIRRTDAGDLGPAVTGIFAGLPEGAAVPALVGFGGVPWWEIYYGANVDGTGNLITTTGGNDVVLLAVPEPTTLGVIGAASLIALRRRSTKRA
jgi:autotransporter-associated beta strand protein